MDLSIWTGVCVLGEQDASLMRNRCIFIAAEIETFSDLELMHCMSKMWVSKFLLFCSFLKYQCPLTVIRNTYYLFKSFFPGIQSTVEIPSMIIYVYSSFESSLFTHNAKLEVDNFTHSPHFHQPFFMSKRLV